MARFSACVIYTAAKEFPQYLVGINYTNCQTNVLFSDKRADIQPKGQELRAGRGVQSKEENHGLASWRRE